MYKDFRDWDGKGDLELTDYKSYNARNVIQLQRYSLKYNADLGIDYKSFIDSPVDFSQIIVNTIIQNRLAELNIPVESVDFNQIDYTGSYKIGVLNDN